MDRSTMLKLMHKINKIYNLLNKYIYLLPLFSLLSNLIDVKDNKFFNLIRILIKLFIIISIVFSVTLILYFTDLSTPINNTYSLYYDLLEPYIEMLKHLWNKLLSYFNNSITSTESNSQIKELESVLKDNTSLIRDQVKAGIKEGITEALNEFDVEDKPNTLKNLALISSGLFFFYVIFVLPGPFITPDNLNQFNWFNQGLIEFKISVKDFIIQLISNSSKPGAGSSSSIIPITPVISEGSLATITPNTPISNIQTLNQYTKEVRDISIQTNLNSISVSKLVESVNILADVLPEDSKELIVNHANKTINKITD
jgi:hypothetical protein